MSDCKLERGPGSAPIDLDAPLRCGRCGGNIPASSALSFEGADYVRHFCGLRCLSDWCAGVAQSPGPEDAA